MDKETERQWLEHIITMAMAVRQQRALYKKNIKPNTGKTENKQTEQNRKRFRMLAGS